MSENNAALRSESRREAGEVDVKTRGDLEAYHDRELSWWRRRRMAARLRGSPALRGELELLQQMSAAASLSEGALEAPDLWSGISGRLAEIDAQKRGIAGLESLRDRAVSSPGSTGLSWLFGWKPIGWVLAAGVALAVGLWNTPGSVPGLPGLLEDPQAGVLRYLDTGGRSVMVMDEEDVTIIWLIESGDGSDDS